MGDWGKLLIRLFGCLHLIICAAGVFFQAKSAVKILRGDWHLAGRYPYELAAYYVNISVSALIIGCLVLAGIWLIRVRRRGVTLSNIVLTFEVLYWIANPLISLWLDMHGKKAADIGYSMGAAAGIGQIAISLQFFTGYPLIALVGLNIARRHLDRKGLWADSPRS